VLERSAVKVRTFRSEKGVWERGGERFDRGFGSAAHEISRMARGLKETLQRLRVRPAGS
jgi:hypothetical protein